MENIAEWHHRFNRNRISNNKADLEKMIQRCRHERSSVVKPSARLTELARKIGRFSFGNRFARQRNHWRFAAEHPDRFIECGIAEQCSSHRSRIGQSGKRSL